MHFTLWPSLTSSSGAHAEIAWESFLDFVKAPQIATDKNALEGWSPAKFRENHRAKTDVEAVSCVALDDDKSGLSTAEVLERWQHFAGVVHTSFSHMQPGKGPRHRVVLRCSRDMRGAEYERVWRVVREYAATRGQTLDNSPKDPSRFWFVPAHPPGAPYEWHELVGSVLDVDAILAAPAPETPRAPPEVPRAPPEVPRAPPEAPRRAPIAAMLAAAWPAKGQRHEAQLALAGALRAEGWDEADAVEFLCDVCAAAGDEDRTKREATCAHTWATTGPLTGWTRLKAFIDPVVVDAARGALGRDAETREAVARKLAEAEQLAAPAPVTPASSDDLGIKWGGWNEPVVVPPYLLHGLIPAGSVCTFFAEGGSVKTWAAFALALSVATGRKWLGEYVVKPGRALLLDWEDGREEFKRRRQILVPGQDDFPSLGYKWGQLDLLRPDTWLALASLGLELVVVDSLGTAMPGDADENATEFAAAVKHAGKLAETCKTTVLFVHHANKSGGMRGTSAIRDQSDCAFKFEAVSEENDVKRMRLVCDKPGPQKKPAPVNIELSDRGLCTFKEEAQPTPENGARERIIRILSQYPAGVPKADLFNLVKGDIKVFRSELSQLSVSGVVDELRDGGRYGKVVVFLKGAAS